MAKKGNNILQKILSVFKKKNLLLGQGSYRELYKELIADFSTEDLRKFDLEVENGNHLFFRNFNEDSSILVPALDAYQMVNPGLVKSIFENNELFDEVIEKIRSFDPERMESDERAAITCMEIGSFDDGRKHGIWGFNVNFSALLYAARVVYENTSSPGIKNKMEILETELSLDKLRQGDFSLLIQGDIYSVPKSFLIDIILGTPEELKGYFEDRDNIESKKLEIALKKFISTGDNRSHILEYFDFPEKAYCMCEDILETSFTDTEVMEAKVDDRTKFSDEIQLTEELKEAVYKDMPDGLNKLERAVYIYGRLCQILTYDPGVYAESEKGPITLRHENRARLNTITPENNRVICYEFSYLYAKFLEEQQIKHNVFSKSRYKEYGGAHAHCEFVVDDMHIKADSTEVFFEGDLIAMKCGYRPNGLKVLTRFPEKREKMQVAIDRMIELLNNPQMQPPTSELINLYMDISAKEALIPVGERFDTFRQLIEKDKYTAPYSLEATTYALQMSRMIFNKNRRNREGEDSVRLEIMKRHASMPTAIIEHRHASTGKSTYYEYGPDKTFEEKSATQLKSDLMSGRLDLIGRRKEAMNFANRICNMADIEGRNTIREEIT